MYKEESKTELALITQQDNIMSRIEKAGIGAPSNSDKEWALNLSSTSWSLTGGKASKFLKAVSLGHLWRVAYAVQLNEKYNDKEKFINKTTGTRALYQAAEKNHEPVVEYLLNEDFALKYSYSKSFLDQSVVYKHIKALAHLINSGAYSIEGDDGYLLFKASSHSMTVLCLQLLRLGLNAEDGLTMARNKGASYAVDIIKEAMKLKEEKEQPKQIEQTIDVEPKVIEEKAQAEQEKDPMWDAMDDNTIVKHEDVPNTNIELKTVFNFLSRDVTTICCVNGQAPANVTIRKFQDLESDSALFVAWKKLKDLGKAPIPFNGNDNFRVHKPSIPQNVKIEGGSNNGG